MQMNLNRNFSIQADPKNRVSARSGDFDGNREYNASELSEVNMQIDQSHSMFAINETNINMD